MTPDPRCECVMRGMTGGKAHPLCPVHGHLHEGGSSYVRADLAAAIKAEKQAVAPAATVGPMATGVNGINNDAHDSTLALVSRQLSAAYNASHREIDAPMYPTNDQRVAWADGYTQACEDIREAIREVAHHD